MYKHNESHNSQFDALVAWSKQLQFGVKELWSGERWAPHVLLAAAITVGVLMPLLF